MNKVCPPIRRDDLSLVFSFHPSSTILTVQGEVEVVELCEGLACPKVGLRVGVAAPQQAAKYHYYLLFIILIIYHPTLTVQQIGYEPEALKLQEKETGIIMALFSC